MGVYLCQGIDGLCAFRRGNENEGVSGGGGIYKKLPHFRQPPLVRLVREMEIHNPAERILQNGSILIIGIKGIVATGNGLHDVADPGPEEFPAVGAGYFSLRPVLTGAVDLGGFKTVLD